MKRSKAVHLLLMGLAPVAVLSGCDQDKTTVKTVKTNDSFARIQDCVAAGKPEQVCAESYMAALSRHKTVAPTYEKEADCEADFMPGYCVTTDSNKFMPKMAGFSLVTETRQVVDKTTGTPVVTPHTDSNGFITGMLLGNLMSGNGGTVYHSDPYYSRRDSNGLQSNNTLNGFASNGFTPSRSIQERARSYSNSQAPVINSNTTYRTTRDDSVESSNSNGSNTGYRSSINNYDSSSQKKDRESVSSRPINSGYNYTSTPSTSGYGSTNSRAASTSSPPSNSERSSFSNSPSSMSVSRAVSRGGFGSTATAKSSFGSSFGG